MLLFSSQATQLSVALQHYPSISGHLENTGPASERFPFPVKRTASWLEDARKPEAQSELHLSYRALDCFRVTGKAPFEFAVKEKASTKLGLA
jgi:hypothetical protein